MSHARGRGMVGMGVDDPLRGVTVPTYIRRGKQVIGVANVERQKRDRKQLSCIRTAAAGVSAQPAMGGFSSCCPSCWTDHLPSSSSSLTSLA